MNSAMKLSKRLICGLAWAALGLPAFSQVAPDAPDPASARTLPTVTVTNTPTATRPGALRDEVVKTESISAQEIQNSGAANLPELLAGRPGIDTQVECSVCNTRQITLNNLPGRFTTLMVDGVPIFSSVSNAYGLDMIGLNSLERVDISRGAGTSLIAPDSLAGTVNLVTKWPKTDSAEIDLDVGSYGMQRESLYGTELIQGGALMVTAVHQSQDSADSIGDGISQSAGFNRNQLGLGLFLDDVGGFRVKTRFDHLEEQRMGGPLGSDYYGVIANTTGNPFNFSAGPNGSPASNDWINPATGKLTGTPYDAGAFGLAQIIFTTRNQIVSTAEEMTGYGKLRLAFGYAEHDQNSWYGGDANYFGNQQQYYLESSLQQSLGDTLVTAGINYRYEDLRSTSYPNNAPPALVNADAYAYRTPGVFLQAYRSFFDEKLELNASLRYDSNNDFGGIATPRLDLLWHHTDETSSRLAMGTGYRLPTSFFELDHAILDASSVDRSRAEAERSENISYAWNYAGDRTTITTSANHTRINNMALFLQDPANPTGLVLAPAASAYTIDNVDFVGTWQVSAKDAITLGLEKYTYQFNPADFQGQLFSRPDYRASLALDHTNGPWNLNIKATFTGPQNLAAFYDYADNPRYNLDGTPKIADSPTFWVVDMHANYQLTPKISGFLGVNNVFNYTQGSVDNPLFVDSTGNLNVTHLWGPLIGRTMNAGIRVLF